MLTAVSVCVVWMLGKVLKRPERCLLCASFESAVAVAVLLFERGICCDGDVSQAGREEAFGQCTK